MYRCPRCNSELPEHARFCNKCGFNQTNARLMAMSSAQAAPPAANPKDNAQAPSQPGAPLAIPQKAAPGAAPAPPPPGAIQPVRANTPPRPKDAGPATAPEARPETPSSPVQPATGSEAAPAKGLSLTKRYIAEQETRHQMAQPAPGRAAPLPNTPVAPSLPAKPKKVRSPQRQPEQVIRTSTPPPVVDLPTAHFPATAGPQAPQPAGGTQQANLPGAHPPLAPASQPPAKRSLQWDESDLLLDDEDYSMMSEEAEQWRNSWRDRQRAEAGPAIDVSRGQASVREPLMAMQQSLARMRAIILTRYEDENRRGPSVGFWLIVGLLILLILALGAYIISTYLPGAQSSFQLAPLHTTILTIPGGKYSCLA